MSNKGSKHNFAFWVARRYLFSKKSHNAINIISAISATGVLIGTAALIIVLSVFNGFESLVQSMFSAFDPDLKISLVKGKVFDANRTEFKQIKEHKAVASFADVIEETALLSFADRQTPVQAMGVSESFNEITKIENILYDGSFQLQEGVLEKAVLGIGIAVKMGLASSRIEPMQLYAPKRNERVNLVRPDLSFNNEFLYTAGVFGINQAEYDEQMVLISLDLARKLFDYDENTISNLQIKLTPNSSVKAVKKEFQNLLGSDFKVQNKYEQKEDFYKITKIEKWITYLILIFILMIATFNIIGSLSMLIIEKEEDIEILRSLGADEKLIKRIFMYEGWLITTLGAVIGVLIGVVVVLVQQQFGLLKLGSSNYIIDAYPVVLQASDILITLFSVVLMGLLAVLYPVKYISKKNEQATKS